MSQWSEAVEDYVREIFNLGATGDRVATSALAERVGVSPPSATAMVKRLAALGLVDHQPYRGVVLTEEGRRLALEITRHHRLIEQYLVDTLGVPLDAVHAEADRLEHAISEELEARIDALLGFPTHDPHGDPIPTRELELTPPALRSLAELEPGEEATVRRVPDGDPPLLRYLASMALVPGQLVKLLRTAPFGEPLTVQTGGDQHAISRALALQIGVG